MKEKLLAVLIALGFAEKAKTNALTPDDWNAVAAAFEKQYGVSFEQAVAESNKGVTVSPETMAAAAAMLGDDKAANQTPDGTVAQLTQTVAEQKAVIEKLADEPENKKTVMAVVGSPSAIGQTAMEITRRALTGRHTETHLFGIENGLYATNRRWNKILQTFKKPEGRFTAEEREQFLTDFTQFSNQFSERYAELQRTGQLGTLMAAGDIDYTALDAVHGQKYLVRRIDAIITYLKQLPSISQFFPVRYGVQDQEAVTDSYIGQSFTQAYQAGKVFAGSHKFAPIIAQVKDVMFKFKFADLKKLETEYIGYLNREGSHPMKWTFIEWIMVQNSLKQYNEVEIRRVKGVRVEPTTGKAQFFTYASDGFIATILKHIDEEIRAYQFTDLKGYSTSTILEYVRTFVRRVYRMKGNLMGMALYMNELHLPDFYEAYREKYGTDNNFTGEKKEVKDFPLPKIVGLPNMGDSMLMFMAYDGTIEILENEAGEGFRYDYQRDLEELYVTSYKKEGTFSFSGRKFDTVAAQTASKGAQTNLFVNFPVTELVADATTADATVNTMFRTIANTGATVLTDFAGAVQGELYVIYCGSTTNATTIAKSGKFSTLTTAWTPSAVGDYLKVIYDPTAGKFYDHSRKVAGTVAINTNLVSPEYAETI